MWGSCYLARQGSRAGVQGQLADTLNHPLPKGPLQFRLEAWACVAKTSPCLDSLFGAPCPLPLQTWVEEGEVRSGRGMEGKGRSHLCQDILFICMEQCCDDPTHLSQQDERNSPPSEEWNVPTEVDQSGQLPVTGGHIWAPVWFSDAGIFKFQSWQDQKGSEGLRALCPTMRLSAGVQPETTEEFALLLPEISLGARVSRSLSRNPRAPTACAHQPDFRVTPTLEGRAAFCRTSP